MITYTLWDKLKCVARRGDYAAPDADLLAQNRMAAGIYLTCQGLPFMQGAKSLPAPSMATTTPTAARWS